MHTRQIIKVKINLVAIRLHLTQESILRDWVAVHLLVTVLNLAESIHFIGAHVHQRVKLPLHLIEGLHGLFPRRLTVLMILYLPLGFVWTFHGDLGAGLDQ